MVPVTFFWVSVLSKQQQTAISHAQNLIHSNTKSDGLECQSARIARGQANEIVYEH